MISLCALDCIETGFKQSVNFQISGGYAVLPRVFDLFHAIACALPCAEAQLCHHIALI